MKNRKLIWLIIIAAVIIAAAVLLIVLRPDGTGDTEARTTRLTGDEAGVTVTTGLAPADYADSGKVTAWLEKCSRSDRDDVGVYALAWAAKDDDTMMCRWLILRTGVTEAAVPDTDVIVNGKRQYQVTVTYVPTGENASGTDLILVEGIFETDEAPALDVVWDTEDLNGLLITYTDERF